MRRHWKLRRDPTKVDQMLRSARPAPRDEFVREQVARLRPERERRALAPRLAPAAGLTAVFVGALAWVGGLGYVASGAQQALNVVQGAVSSDGGTVLRSPSSDQYKPGKGCGDPNHLHERKAMCKGNVADASVKEGNLGATTNMVFTVTLSDVALSTVRIVYSTADGTATVADGDYLPVTGATLSILAGQSSGTITVPIVGDNVVEPNEFFYVNITSVSANAYFEDSQAVGTIFNDDLR